MDLANASSVLRLLADPTRVRLLALLEREELTVAELAAVLRLAQPRVSTHLAKLKEAGLVRDRRAGVSAYYRANNEGDEHQHALLRSLRESIDDALLREDADRLPGVLAQRAREAGWADTVAGDMERHYSPGRTWETLARALLQLLETGDVLDIASGDGVTAELLAPHARSIVCVDSSERVVEAAARRLKPFPNVEVRQGDMHALELGRRRFDLVLMLHALTYAEQPARAVAEAARLLRGGGRLLAVTLGKHSHRAVVEPFDHRNLGFSQAELEGHARAAGLDVLSCTRLSRERKAPHFEVISLLAQKKR
ncbi:metalloregulator ArsR/SmtB family transcription factor [Fulvimonas soli]|jgi:ArsR family transcriptional regulator|uniref:ArsR family transcriptional regulator /transcriptional regulator n=1 Tax=Fulvimonas soli TaxID=155197 RepID=A0A316J026_9GAMM|nr:metalloregulator ArsR/SmtB family transcription factor [Fulvimonas soli]PWK92855.1 ArsR family transcriptional regulator /transcriptional regulator [Fulvimonas soli]TNY24878.1 ArsR family transcriptional regulator [Fulvimonas soli]